MNVPALVEEFTRTLYEEIDYLAEGRNAETFAANFEGQPGILVPKVIWTHTTRRVLTLENVTGIKITDYDAISEAGIDRGEVATRLLDTYLQQIFKDGFFHADPHPGNLFVRACESDKNQDDHSPNWQLTFVDFGMVGRIPPKTRAGIREMLIGVGLRDTGRVVKSYQMLGILLPGADLERIEEAGEELFNRFWGKNMTELTQVDYNDMEDYAREFGDLIYTLPFQVPQDIIFLVRAVGILSGMCTGLDPNFNVWGHLAPFSQKLMTEEILGQSKNWIEEIGGVARRILAFPGRIDSLLDKLERGKLVVQNPDLTKELRRLEAAIGRFSATLISISLLFLAVWLYLSGEIWLAGVFLLGSLATWIWSIFRRR
jgi:predicted unusual protein kinase regulating ubiquinone biosynthesis (AarF/ABC1/UbiB family)